MVEKEPYIFPVRVEFKDKCLITLFNLNSGPIDSLVLNVGGINLDKVITKLLTGKESGGKQT